MEGPFFNMIQAKHPLDIAPHNVNVEMNVQYLGRPAVKVNFTDEYEKITGIQGNGYAEIPNINFYEGIIEVDIAAEINRHGAADDESRAFAGIAFRKVAEDQYDAVYMKMANGLLNKNPPVGEDVNKAVQYISPPQWVFYKLEKAFPGKQQSSAKIALRRWNHLKLVVKDHTVTASIDGSVVFDKLDLMGSGSSGSIALFVDACTDAYFTNLLVKHD